MRHPKDTPSVSSLFRLKHTKGILFLCVLAVLLTVAVNLFVKQLPVRYTRFDTTDIALYSISDFTEQMTANLEQDITIYLVAQYGHEDLILQELLSRYADLSDRITVQQIDPVLQPDLLSQYASSLESNSLIVTANDRFRVLKPSELYVETPPEVGNASGGGNSYFAGEQEITSAIAFVTSDYLPKLYQLTGHGEQPLPDYVQTALTRENIEVLPLHLATVQAVPQDADLLLLYTPERDLSQEEATMLLSYLQSGGRMMIVGSGMVEPSPNLDSVAAYYGIARVEGTVVETNNNYFLDQYPSYVLANIGNHPITQPLVNQGYFILSPMAQGLIPTGSARESVLPSALLYTTEAAMSIATDEQGKASEILMQGPFTLGLAVEEATDTKPTRLVWFTSSYLLLEDINALSSGANLDLFLNTLSWINDVDHGISIRSKALMMDYLTIRANTGRWLGILLIAVIPLSILAVGTFLLRRRGKR